MFVGCWKQQDSATCRWDWQPISFRRWLIWGTTKKEFRTRRCWEMRCACKLATGGCHVTIMCGTSRSTDKVAGSYLARHYQHDHISNRDKHCLRILYTEYPGPPHHPPGHLGILTPYTTLFLHTLWLLYPMYCWFHLCLHSVCFAVLYSALIFGEFQFYSRVYTTLHMHSVQTQLKPTALYTYSYNTD